MLLTVGIVVNANHNSHHTVLAGNTGAAKGTIYVFGSGLGAWRRIEYIRADYGSGYNDRWQHLGAFSAQGKYQTDIWMYGIVFSGALSAPYETTTEDFFSNTFDYDSDSIVIQATYFNGAVKNFIQLTEGIEKRWLLLTAQLNLQTILSQLMTRLLGVVFPTLSISTLSYSLNL